MYFIMKKTIKKFGFYGGLTGGLIFAGSHFLDWKMGFGLLEIFGYLAIFTSLTFVFFGIKHFRDQINNGIVTFGKALGIGLAISAIAGLTIGLLDIIYVTLINPNFATEYIQYTLEGMKETLTAAEFEIQKAKIVDEMEFFSNPIFSGFFMFTIVFTFGIIISLISSLILQRKK